MKPEDNVLNMERDLPLIAEKIDWMEDKEAAAKAVIAFCNGKTHS